MNIYANFSKRFLEILKYVFIPQNLSVKDKLAIINHEKKAVATHAFILVSFFGIYFVSFLPEGFSGFFNLSFYLLVGLTLFSVVFIILISRSKNIKRVYKKNILLIYPVFLPVFMALLFHFSDSYEFLFTVPVCSYSLVLFFYAALITVSALYLDPYLVIYYTGFVFIMLFLALFFFPELVSNTEAHAEGLSQSRGNLAMPGKIWLVGQFGFILYFLCRWGRNFLLEFIKYEEKLEKKIQQKTRTLLNLNSDLEKRNRELKDMQSQIVQSEKLASIGQLAAGIAHEINNPVGFISSNSSSLKTYISYIKQILKMHQASEDPAKIKEAEKEFNIEYILEDIDDLLEDNEAGLTRVTDIVKNLKDFSRIDVASEYVKAGVNQLIQNTLTVARNEIKYLADVKTDFTDDDDVLCHVGEINQVFLNMIINAAQAIKSQDRKDHGNIFIKTEKVTLKDERYIKILIRDDGPGISEDHIKKVFDPFFTTKRVGEGTGLGLSISYDVIVNKHNGKIDVKSFPEGGTEFVIFLPVSFNADLIKKKHSYKIS